MSQTCERKLRLHDHDHLFPLRVKLVGGFAKIETTTFNAMSVELINKSTTPPHPSTN